MAHFVGLELIHCRTQVTGREEGYMVELSMVLHVLSPGLKNCVSPSSVAHLLKLCWSRAHSPQKFQVTDMNLELVVNCFPVVP